MARTQQNKPHRRQVKKLIDNAQEIKLGGGNKAQVNITSTLNILEGFKNEQQVIQNYISQNPNSPYQITFHVMTTLNNQQIISEFNLDLSSFKNLQQPQLIQQDIPQLQEDSLSQTPQATYHTQDQAKNDQTPHKDFYDETIQDIQDVSHCLADHECGSLLDETDDDSDYEQGKLSTDSKRIKKYKKRKYRKTSEVQVTQENVQQPVKREDRKNLVKNFVKAFRNFVLDENEKESIAPISPNNSYEQSKQLIQNFLRNKNFNNKLIHDIVTHKHLKSIFLFFLQKRAQEWIANGAIHDKDTHLKTRDQYIKLILDDEYKIRMLKSLGKTSSGYQHKLVNQKK